MSELKTNRPIKKILTYIIGGVVSYLLKLIFTMLFVEYFEWNESYSYFIAIILTVLIMFWYLARVTFGVDGKLHNKVSGYVLTLIGSYLADLGLMIFLTHAGLDYRISLTISTITMAILKYMVFNWIVFK